MANKTLKTRIKLRYDTLANWTSTNPILLAGEIAVVQIPTKDIANTNLPPIMFKVGDGVVGTDGTITGTNFNSLGWTSGLAADVYDWAKAATKPSYTASEVGAATAADITAEINKLDVNDTAVSGQYVSSVSETDGKIKVTRAALPTFTDTDTQYQLVLNGHTLKLQSKAKGATTWSDVSGQSFALPDNNTTYTFAEGTTNGAFSVTPSGGTAQSVKIHGLGTAAYKAEGDFDKFGAAAEVLGSSSDAATVNTVYGAKKAAAAAQTKADTATTNAAAAQKTADDHIADKANPHGVTKAQVGLGSVVNAGRDTAVTADSTNYITSGAVKTYVDNAVGAVKQFQYEVITGDLPTASASTMGKIYLKAHEHGTSDGYDEWITIETGSTTKTYSWEKIGNTDIDLTDYVNTLSGTANNGVITGLTKSGKTLTITSTDISSSSTATSGKYISGITQDKTGKITEIATSSLPTFTDHNQTVQAGDVTFGADVAVKVVGDRGITVAGDTANGSITIQGPVVDGIYNATNNKVATVATVTSAVNNAINALDVTDTAVTNQYVTAVSETDGKIAITRKQISYAELSNKPTIPSVGNAAIKGTDGTAIFTANATEDVTITIIDCGGASE